MEYSMLDNDIKDFGREYRHQAMSKNCPDWEWKQIYIAEWIKNISPTADLISYSEKYRKSDKNRKNRVLKNFQTNSTTFQRIFHDSSSIKWNLGETRCIISWNTCRLFYQNGILSRRRLAEVTIRFHTRTTCIPGSHKLPRSELPRGLQDCL